MRIYDRQPSGDHHQTRKFQCTDPAISELRPGALVCLRDASGSLVVARQGAKQGSWELAAQRLPPPNKSLPAEALFTVVRRGSQVGFQSLG